jgi:O-antigen/teichoic acid export membrane protein
VTDSRPIARPTSSPYTSLLRYILTDDRRTVRAQRLLVTAAGCVIALFVVLVTIALLANDVVGWVPVASGSGAVTAVGAVARWRAVRRRRHHELHGPSRSPKRGHEHI